MIKLSISYFTKKDIPAMVSLAVGIALTVFVFMIMQSLEFTSIRNEFISDTQNYSVALEKSIEGNLNSLNAIEGLYATSPKITRARFHTFANNILLHSDGIHALRWIPRVAGAERKRYEAAAVKDGYSKYHFVELNSQKQLVTANKRDYYYPIYFSELLGEQEAALGLDLSANPRSRSSLEKARDTGAAVATRRITLILENDPQFAFFVFQPIYRNASPHATIQERRANLTGFAQGVFRFGDMVRAALKGLNLKGIELSLTEESAAPDRRMLYSNLRQDHSAGEKLSFTKTLSIADRSWTLKFYSTPEYLSAHKTHYSWAVLAAGLTATVLLALYILNMKRHAFEMERSKNTITTVLNSINATIAVVDSKDLKILACNRIFIHESGVPENEVIGKRCHEIAFKKPLPCDRFCEKCPVTLAKRRGEYESRESSHRGADGVERYLEMSAFPVKDNTGSVTQIVHIAQDITERKQVENSRLEEQQLRRISAERQVVETQLRMLQAQIEPHFLFNTIANVICLVDKEPKAAKETLQQLTRFLSISLKRSREDTSTLGQETEMLNDYLSIFKVRLGPRLDFAIDIPKDLLSLPFPPMILQPVVENAIKHGIEPKEEGGRIFIKAEQSDGLLRLTVSDTGLGFSGSMHSHGFGLENVRARLQALYPVRAALILEENLPCGVTTTIEVPV